MLLVADLERSVAYYRDRLGFECHEHGDPPNFATASRDGQTILLSLAQDSSRLVPHWQIVLELADQIALDRRAHPGDDPV